MNKENCALKLVDEIILYYDARSKKHQMNSKQTASHATVCPILELKFSNGIFLKSVIFEAFIRNRLANDAE